MISRHGRVASHVDAGVERTERGDYASIQEISSYCYCHYI